MEKKERSYERKLFDDAKMCDLYCRVKTDLDTC